jgi:DNA polymerase III delta prime subunit
MTQFDQRFQQVDTQYNADHITIQQQPFTLTEKQRKQNRTRMLDRVQAIWINGVLEPSMQGAAQIILELQNKPNAIVTPLWHVLREFDTTGQLSSTDVSIVQVYDHANGEVLILGEPGAGKTTLLLELSRDLLKRARQDEAHPIPVIFPLSSWTARRQPLTEWLASELQIRYQVPLSLASSWIEKDEVLPLLDGLDEVTAPHRVECVEAINTYRRAHGLLPTVVCSRKIDYLTLSARLLLRTAVVVQPLTPEQVTSYLASGGERLEVLRQTLREDADLRELASTPLMLNVLTVAYQGVPRKEVAVTGSFEMKQEQVFASYVQRMLTRRTPNTRYTPQQTMHWLSWLAQQMKRHNQMEFYIERMQPDWLPKIQLGWLSYSTFVRLGVVLISGLVFGLIYGLLDELAFGLPSKLLSNFNIAQVNGLRDGLLGGLIFGLLFGLTSRVKTEIKPAEVIVWSWGGVRRRSGLIKGCIGGLIMGSINGLRFAVFIGLSYGVISGLIYGLVFGLIYGLIFGLIVGFVSLLPRRVFDKHPPIMARQGKLGFARKSILIGLIVGPIVGPILGVALYNDSVAIVGYGLAAGLVVALVVGLLVRLSRSMPDRQPLVAPLQGKRHSMRDGILVGLVIWLLSGLVFGLLAGWTYGLADGVVYGLSYGLVSGLLGVWSSEMLDMYGPVGLGIGLVKGLVIGLIFGVIYGLVDGLYYNDGLVNGLLVGVIYGLLGWLVGWSTIGLTSRPETEMKPVRVSMWQKLVQIESLRNVLGFGLVTIVLGGLFYRYDLGTELLGGLVFGLVGWLFFGLLSWVTGGLSSETLDEHILVSPNQGIRNSARNSVRTGLIFGLVFGLFAGLITGLVFSFGGLVVGLIVGLTFGLSIATIGGLSVGLPNGGVACIQHTILRLLLWRRGYIPWNYPQFLDYATERILLRKVGGGYIFLHRLLLDYFADLENGLGSIVSTENRQERLLSDKMPSALVEPTGTDEHSDVPTAPLAPNPVLSDLPHLLSCGHESRPSARFCSVCGAPIQSTSLE